MRQLSFIAATAPAPAAPTTGRARPMGRRALHRAIHGCHGRFRHWVHRTALSTDLGGDFPMIYDRAEAARLLIGMAGIVVITAILLVVTAFASVPARLL